MCVSGFMLQIGAIAHTTTAISRSVSGGNLYRWE